MRRTVVPVCAAMAIAAALLIAPGAIAWAASPTRAGAPACHLLAQNQLRPLVGLRWDRKPSVYGVIGPRGAAFSECTWGGPGPRLVSVDWYRQDAPGAYARILAHLRPYRIVPRFYLRAAFSPHAGALLVLTARGLLQLVVHPTQKEALYEQVLRTIVSRTTRMTG